MVDVTTENMGKRLALCHYAVHNWVPCNYKKHLKKIQRVLKNNPLYQRLRVLNDQLFLGSASTFRLWELNFNLGCCGCQWLTMLILWPRR